VAARVGCSVRVLEAGGRFVAELGSSAVAAVGVTSNLQAATFAVSAASAAMRMLRSRILVMCSLS